MNNNGSNNSSSVWSQAVAGREAKSMSSLLSSGASKKPSKRSIQDRYKSSPAINTTTQKSADDDEKCGVAFDVPEDITNDVCLKAAAPEQPNNEFSSSPKQSTPTEDHNKQEEESGSPFSLQATRNDNHDGGNDHDIYESDEGGSIHSDDKRRSSRPNTPYSRSERKIEVKLSWKRLILLLVFLIIFPIFPIAISAALGGILALVEGASFVDGFLYVASNLLNFATPLTDFNPNNAAGAIVDVYVSVVGYLTFGIVLNVINVFQVPLYVNQRIESCVSGPIIVPTIALGFVIPLYVSIVGIVFGAFLAWLEGWAIVDGILYTLSNILGLATPLVDMVPETMMGDIIDIIISSIALGAAAVVVDYVTVLNPARYIRKRLRDRLDQMQAIDVDEPGIPSKHPLAYRTEEEENESIRQDEEQRMMNRMEKDEEQRMMDRMEKEYENTTSSF